MPVCAEKKKWEKEKKNKKRDEEKEEKRRGEIILCEVCSVLMREQETDSH